MKINHPADQHSKIYPAFIGGGAFNGMAAIEILLYISLLLVFCNAVFKKKELNFSQTTIMQADSVQSAFLDS